jgi:hypothetical protein
MKNRTDNLSYFFLAILFSLLFWLSQRPLTDGLINLIFDTDDSFISIINNVGLYIIGTILLSSALAWKLKSKRERLNSSPAVFLGVKVRRGMLFAVSLIFILMSLLHFDIFTKTKIHAVNILSMKPYDSTSYSEISNADILATFDLYNRGKRLTRFYCSSHVSYNIQSKQNKVKGVIPFNKVGELGKLIKSNNVPYTVNYVNNCKDNPVPADQKALIEDAFGVQLDL